MANNIVIRDSAKPKFLDSDLQTFLAGLDVRIFVNNLSPVDPTAGNVQFTECTDSGYAPQSQVYGAPYLNGSNQGQIDAAVLSWIMNHNAGDYTVYGVYATDPSDSDAWVWAARSTTPFLVSAPSQVVQNATSYLADQLP